MDLTRELTARGQQHLLRTEGLTPAEKEEYFKRIAQIDWDTVGLWNRPEEEKAGQISPIAGLRLSALRKDAARYRKAGEDAIRAGKVAAVLLAGGQGTRLGSDAPKGMYDIGVTRPLSIFEQLIENLRGTTAAAGAYVPLFVMTSDKNDAQTRAFFEEHAYFGYPASEIFFFRQEMAPCVDLNGKILLEGPGKLALSPNGNGGWYASLLRAGLGETLRTRGIEWINVFAVDNVLQRIADPYFLGATILSGKECGAKVVAKASPEEKVGVLCLQDGLPAVIEYYELTEEMANARDGHGDLLYLYGVILNYLFHAPRLDEIAREKIPVHVVKKKIPYMNEAGELVKPERENGYKFETLILDMIKLMGSCLPYEVVREREFAPIKNKTGTDSVESARRLLEENGVKL